MADDPRIHEDSQSPVDEGLHCLCCEYNLTGLDDGACPECGDLFEREQLLAYFAGAPAPIPVWDQRTRVGTIPAFIRTLFWIWLHPIRYTKRFPVNPVKDEPLLFARMCLGAALLILLIPNIFANSPDSTYFLMVTGLGVCATVCVNICERLATVILLTSVEKDGPVDGLHDRSLALVRMTRGYLVLSALILAVAWSGNTIFSGKWHTTPVADWGIPFILGYWWVSMTCIAATYRRDVWNLVLSIMLIPVVAALSIGLALAMMSLLGAATGTMIQLW